MRSLRWLLLVAILALVAAVSGIYRNQRIAARAHARALPPALPVGTPGNAQKTVNRPWLSRRRTFACRTAD